MPSQTVAEVLARLPSPAVPRLPAPAYRPPPGAERMARVGLAVASMQAHTSDEGWQLFEGLEMGAEGWTLAGHGLSTYGGHKNSHTLDWLTDVPRILDWVQPAVALVQDAREWQGLTAGGPRGFNHLESFTCVGALRERPDVFKLTVLKDAQARPDYHRAAADEIGCHAWVVYYHPAVVAHVAPYVRPGHLVRTYHSVDPAAVPAYTPHGRAGCLLSGAISGAYPLRTRLLREAARLPECSVLPHPGYRRDGCRTPEFLKALSRHKVAVCTASVYGYALRKLVEGVACGCVVVTDLPADEVLPEIDEVLVRIRPDTPTGVIADLLRGLYASYDPERQAHYAAKATAYYSFREAGRRLAADIEALRRGYGCR